jgi:hypothetical protein
VGELNARNDPCAGELKVNPIMPDEDEDEKEEGRELLFSSLSLLLCAD